jgi:hypothetical protein
MYENHKIKWLCRINEKEQESSSLMPLPQQGRKTGRFPR